VPGNVREKVMAQSFNPPGVWSPFGAFSMVVLQGQGQIVHLKGQVSLDGDGRIVGKDDMRAQVRQTLENIRAVLASLGGTMANVISLTHYATDIQKFMETGDIRKEFFAEPYPVTTTVQVSRLYHADLMIEITAIAEIPRERLRHP
jgi:2-iminobutanoate/2-iminopropanoate deaminase